MALSRNLLCSLTTLLVLLLFMPFNSSTTVSHDGRAIKIDGKHRVLLSGSIHYPRSTVDMWPDLIKKAKEGGLDAIETYVFWNAHEPWRRQYDFDGNLDLVRFIKTIQNEGLYAVLRIGPYVCAEWDYGGFPVWLHNLPGIEMRTYNDVFMNEMKNFTTLIVDMLKKENLFASQGGPIILAQIENEYGNVMTPGDDDEKAYVQWCADMAVEQNIGVPWIMCQQSDAPQPMIDTCNGFYCDQFTPNNPNSPKMWTENWTGWFKSWGGSDPHRTAEDLAFSTARFFQNGGTFQNYYMYHGGTNFGRTSGGPYIITSYDYDAPLDEFGNLNQPKWGHLKELHRVLHSIEKPLTEGNITNIYLGNSVYATIYATPDVSSCFLGNANSTSDATFDFQGSTYTVPAWSVSILPDCKTEEYNTAKVNTQTSLMVKRPNKAEDEPESLQWTWRPEYVDETVIFGKGRAFAHQIVDQKTAASDHSDYLWYMTTMDIKHDDPILTDDMSIRVNGSGHILHVYVNGEHVGSKWAEYGVFNYVFEKNVKFHHGKNVITLLSATVGFQNYGAKFDEIPSGVLSPVEIIGRKGDVTIIKDLSAHKWWYKVRLHGEDSKLYKAKPHASKWVSRDIPTNRTLTWYKTTFKAPLGTAPVAVDLQGLGKGEAWVNGRSIGRYWPSYLADPEGCSSDPCDYRGPYGSNKCLSDCGNPTQRWYHVPRSFMCEDVNTLVLLEEFGGDPSHVNFQTVVVGSACGNVLETKTLELSCHGRPISAIKFASFGDPQGSCGSFLKGTCEAANTTAILKEACVGKESCSIGVLEDTFGPTTCGSSTLKRLAVEVVC